MLQAPQLVFSLDYDENDVVIVDIFTLLHLYLVVGFPTPNFFHEALVRTCEDQGDPAMKI
jgi:hypothetical protein